MRGVRVGKANNTNKVINNIKFVCGLIGLWVFRNWKRKHV